MSEYQYYEFQTIDKPLTDEEQEAISSLSSRVELTRSKAIFTYSYGDFRGDPEQVLAQCFDAMLYMANWGSTQLMFRFPKSLIDLKQVQPYCIEDYVSFSVLGEYVVLNIKCYDEEGRGWFEGEGWLDSVIPLRDDILRQDYRLLYLAWLMSIPMMYYEELDEPIYEPPVPPGLRQLSKPLREFVALFEIDDCLIQIASEVSENQHGVSEEKLYEAVTKLSRDECNAFLTRLVRGEPNLAIAVRRRLQELVEEEQGVPQSEQESQRTAGELLKAAEQERERRRKKQAQEEAAKRKREMEALSQEEPQLWPKVYALIEKKQVKAYDEAVQILSKLKELAVYQRKEAAFQEKINQIHEKNSRLPGLRSRMHDAGLSPK